MKETLIFNVVLWGAILPTIYLGEANWTTLLWVIIAIIFMLAWLIEKLKY